VSNELIIRTKEDTVDFALLKDGKLIELHKEEGQNAFSVGDIFLAKIRKPVSGLNAAFVNVGYEKDAFLHYHDLGPQLRSLLKFIRGVRSGKIKDYSLENFPNEKDINKNGGITEVLKANQSILVQIVKEPISTKGPRISSELSIAGRYLVMVPFSDRVSVSQKISNRGEKDRLKRLVTSIKPKGFGVIIRTVAEGQKVAELDKDLSSLFEKWKEMCDLLVKAKPPSKVLVEVNRASSILRDVFNDSFNGIHSDNEVLCDNIREYLMEIAPGKETIVKHYQGATPIFEKFGIERQIKTSFGKTASMSRGAYLVIEHTEALHVIDVNSGNRSNRAKNQEDTALEVNMLAATEIARQLRLRDMGGIIVIDFIDMVKGEHRRKLYDHLRKEMDDDRAKHKILPPSKFGLVQITRQRVRPEMNIKTSEANPDGSGTEIEAPIAIIDQIHHDLERIIDAKKGKQSKGLTLNIHPFIAAYLKCGIPSIQIQWFFRYKRWIRILPRDAYKFLEYRFKDKQGKTVRPA
jgi:ribonuclease G